MKHLEVISEDTKNRQTNRRDGRYGPRTCILIALGQIAVQPPEMGRPLKDKGVQQSDRGARVRGRQSRSG